MKPWERWFYLCVVFLLCSVIYGQETFNTWSYEELYRTIKLSNAWQKVARSSCDGDIERRDNPGIRHLIEP